MEAINKILVPIDFSCYSKNLLNYANNFAKIFEAKIYLIHVVEPIIYPVDFSMGQIDFPAADFFYPTLTDDIINNYDQVLSMDDEIIDNVDCALIEASNDIETVHIWIEKSTYLPYKMIITKNEGVNNFYEAVFSNWKINPTLPDILFEFSPPANATRIKLKVKNQKNS